MTKRLGVSAALLSFAVLLSVAAAPTASAATATGATEQSVETIYCVGVPSVGTVFPGTMVCVPGP